MTMSWWHSEWNISRVLHLLVFLFQYLFQVLHFATFVSLNLTSHVQIFGDLSEDSFPACLRVT